MIRQSMMLCCVNLQSDPLGNHTAAIVALPVSVDQLDKLCKLLGKCMACGKEVVMTADFELVGYVRQLLGVK